MTDGALRFDGQVVVITGAGGGLGRLHALDLAARGAAVVINDVGAAVDGSGADTSVADRVVAEIQGSGGRAVASYDSVVSVAGGQRVIEVALESFGRIDALVNNAGNMVPGQFGDVSDDDLDAILQVHVRGAFHTTQPAFRAMRDQGYGRIVFTSSSAGAFGSPGLAAYATAKAALLGLARVVALEGAEHAVLANTVLPMGRTRMGGAGPVVRRDDKPAPSSGRQAFLDAIGPELVSPMVVYLASRDCAVSGHVFSAGGRRYARVFTGLARGWVATAGTPAAEDVRDHLAEIEDTSGHTIPGSIADELGTLMDRLGIVP